MKYPKILVLFISYRCNARCVMCSAWQKDHREELGLKDIAQIFSDKILNKSIRIINVTGGEPTLRDDLVEIIKIISGKCRNLRRIDISTNGINTVEAVDRIEQILTYLIPTDIKLSVSISVDGIDEVHDKVRGIPGVFKAVDDTIDKLKELMLLFPAFSMGLNATINRFNFLDLKNILDYSHKKRLGLNFTLAALSEIGIDSLSQRDIFMLSNKERDTVALFIEKLLKTQEMNINYGKFLLHWLKNRTRKGHCTFREGKAILCEPDGLVYQCGNFKDFRMGNIFQSPFKDIIKSNTKHFAQAYKRRCGTCNSNCYI